MNKKTRYEKDKQLRKVLTEMKEKLEKTNDVSEVNIMIEQFDRCSGMHYKVCRVEQETDTELAGATGHPAKYVLKSTRISNRKIREYKKTHKHLITRSCFKDKLSCFVIKDSMNKDSESERAVAGTSTNVDEPSYFEPEDFITKDNPKHSESEDLTSVDESLHVEAKDSMNKDSEFERAVAGTSTNVDEPLYFEIENFMDEYNPKHVESENLTTIGELLKESLTNAYEFLYTDLEDFIGEDNCKRAESEDHTSVDESLHVEAKDSMNKDSESEHAVPGSSTNVDEPSYFEPEDFITEDNPKHSKSEDPTNIDEILFALFKAKDSESTDKQVVPKSPTNVDEFSCVEFKGSVTESDVKQIEFEYLLHLDELPDIEIISFYIDESEHVGPKKSASADELSHIEPEDSISRNDPVNATSGNSTSTDESLCNDIKNVLHIDDAYADVDSTSINESD